MSKRKRSDDDEESRQKDENEDLLEVNHEVDDPDTTVLAEKYILKSPTSDYYKSRNFSKKYLKEKVIILLVNEENDIKNVDLLKQDKSLIGTMKNNFKCPQSPCNILAAELYDEGKDLNVFINPLSISLEYDDENINEEKIAKMKEKFLETENLAI